MTVPSLNDNVPLDTSDRTTIAFAQGGSGLLADADDADLANPDRLLRLAQEAASQASLYMQTNVRHQWARNYKAYANVHANNSKYHSPEYRGRSKLFRPKTRSAVRKKVREAAASLFGSGDVIAVTAMDQSNQMSVASAALKQQILNYRLSRETKRNGIPWFQTAIGAVMSAQITGLIVSKQYWRFAEEELDEPIMKVYEDPVSGERTIDQDYGPIITEDRPAIDLIPAENVLFDFNGDWVRPHQSGQYLRLSYPMAPDDAFVMCSKTDPASPLRQIPWVDGIDDTWFSSASQGSGPIDSIATRSAREQGRDPLMLASGTFGRVWVNEWFMRVRGKDYCFWTLDDNRMLSEPVLTRVAYPHNQGERPVVIGFGSIEPHRPIPMAPVESWQPLQQEINDQANLRLDHLKQIVVPPVKVVRGKGVDLNALNARGPNRIVMMEALADVEVFQYPDTPASAFQENAQLNSDFDDLAGAFNAGTVQTNRQLNETVGGMNLLAGDANGLAEYDLSVIIETWVAPVMTQLLRLEEYYEDDETVLEIAGQRAQLWQKFGMDAITDELLTAETTLTIKAGIGATALPQQKIQKFAMASQVVMQFLQPYVAAGIIKPPMPNIKEIIDTVYGAAGFNDGGERFFVNLDQDAGQPPQQGQDPHAAMLQDKNQIDAQKLQLQAQKIQSDSQLRIADIHARGQEMQAKLQNDAAERQTRVEAERIKANAELGHALMDAAHERGMQAADQAHERGEGLRAHLRDMIAQNNQIDAQQNQTWAKAAGSPAPAGPGWAPGLGGAGAAPAPRYPNDPRARQPNVNPYNNLTTT